MSDTPRTDSQPQITPSDLEDAWKHNAPMVDADFARQLERELTDARKTIESLREAGQDAIDYIDGKHRDAGRVLDGWRKAIK